MSNKVCVPNKTEDLNLSLFSMNTGINESKILTKHISWTCKCIFDVKNVIQMWMLMWMLKISYIWKRLCLASIMDDSAIICDEVIESYEEKTNFNDKKQPVEHKISIFCLHFH